MMKIITYCKYFFGFGQGLLNELSSLTGTLITSFVMAKVYEKNCDVIFDDFLQTSDDLAIFFATETSINPMKFMKDIENEFKSFGLICSMRKMDIRILNDPWSFITFNSQHYTMKGDKIADPMRHEKELLDSRTGTSSYQDYNNMIMQPFNFQIASGSNGFNIVKYHRGLCYYSRGHFLFKNSDYVHIHGIPKKNYPFHPEESFIREITSELKGAIFDYMNLTSSGFTFPTFNVPNRKLLLAISFLSRYIKTHDLDSFTKEKANKAVINRNKAVTFALLYPSEAIKNVFKPILGKSGFKFTIDQIANNEVYRYNIEDVKKSKDMSSTIEVLFDAIEREISGNSITEKDLINGVYHKYCEPEVKEFRNLHSIKIVNKAFDLEEKSTDVQTIVSKENNNRRRNCITACRSLYSPQASFSQFKTLIGKNLISLMKSKFIYVNWLVIGKYKINVYQTFQNGSKYTAFIRDNKIITIIQSQFKENKFISFKITNEVQLIGLNIAKEDNIEYSNSKWIKQAKKHGNRKNNKT